MLAEMPNTSVNYNMRPFCSSLITRSSPPLTAINDFWNIFQVPNDNNSFSLLATMRPTCSENTLFVWIPSLLLLVLSIVELKRLSWHRKTGKIDNEQFQMIPLTVYQLTKILAALLLYGICLSRIIYWMIYADKSLEVSTSANGIVTFVWLDSLAPVLADVIRSTSFLYIVFLLWIHRHFNYLSSAAIFIYLALEVFVSIYSLATLLTNILSEQISPRFVSFFAVSNQPFMLVSKLVFIFALHFLFLICCLSDKDALEKKSSKKSLLDKITSPEQSASFFSKLTFSWFSNLIFKTARVQTLRQEDLWMLSTKNTAQVVMAPFERLLEQNVHKKVDVTNLLLQLYWPNLVIIAIIKLLSSLFIFVNPIALDWIISYMSPSSKEPNWKGYFYATLMLFSPMLESCFTSQYEYHINVITMRMKTCITAAVYNKSFKLSNLAKQQFSTGEIVNFISVDSQRIADFFNNVNTLWSAPIQIAIGVYLLWLQLNYASFAGFSYMLIIIPVNILLTNKIKTIQMKIMSQKDGRSKLMDEILNGIKVIKLNAWEPHFEQKAMNFRQKEMNQLKNYAYSNSFINFFFSSAAFFVALFSFLAFTLISPENIMNANRAFVSLALFNIIRIPLSYLPLLLSYAGIAIVSIRRINEYLNAPEIDPNAVNMLNKNENEIQKKLDKPSGIKPVIRVQDANFSWTPNEPVPALRDINLEINKRQLVAVIGGVGSGKSSLLSALLGDMEKQNGTVEIRGRVGYVPQEAWIRNATIRENILLWKAFDETKYKHILEACALNFDMAMFSAGDMTEVGEKGINLSGGQKQRISIARAVYSNADIYIFDNPLSALDAHVGKQIFEEVIGPTGCLRNKTRLLVTHKISLLSQVDQIVYISQGSIKEVGTFDQLINSKGPFSEYVAEYFIGQAKNGENLDSEEMDFINKMEPQIKPIIERIEMSRSSKGTSSIVGSRPHSIVASRLSSTQATKSVIRSESTTANTSRFFTRGRLIQAEEMAEGSVKMVNHKKYFKTIGYWVCFLIMFSLMMSNVFQVMGSLWLSDWSNDSVEGSIQNDSEQRNKRIIVYAILGLIEVLFSFLGTLGINLGCVKASKLLHNRMLSRIIRAPMSFFDTIPMGRIMNRFSRDIDVIDLQISTSLRLLTMQIFRTIVAFGLISLETPIILAFLIPLSIAYYIVQRLYINTSRQLKRIEAVTRSPMNNYLSETVNGTVSIRTYGLTKKFIKEMKKRIDDNNQSYWLNFAASRWLAIRLEFLSYSIVFISTLFAVYSKGSLSPGIAGLAISYSLNITSILNLFIKGYTDLETNFVAVERVAEYMNVSTEKQSPKDTTNIPNDWPKKGEIVFENYSTQYRPGLPLCLKRLNLTFQAGSKVAVIGRTGSGKSSLSLSLFRILEPIEGTIYIDNVDIRKISLKELRDALVIVPQDPVIFTASLRENVDILRQHSDESIYEALQMANLDKFLESVDYNINYPISAGENLSSGQKQLICLARALLKKSHIIVFDEATASVDYETDMQIHNTIFSPQCQNMTVLMIAHRLDRVMEFDYVLVMKNGEIIEFDSPSRLAANEESSFYALIKEANVI